MRAELKRDANRDSDHHLDHHLDRGLDGRLDRPLASGVLVGAVTQIPRGEGRAFAVAGRRIAVFHTHSGEVFATQGECPHLQGPLADGLTGGTTVICPLHERSYDLRTGQGLNGECSNLQVYPVSLGQDGQIWVTIDG